MEEEFSKFINLHHHDEYSLRDGLGTVDDLVKWLKAHGLKHCCVTNHGSLGGWVKQYFACKKNDLFPIFGMEAYTSEVRKEELEDFGPDKERFKVMQAEYQDFRDNHKPPTKEPKPKDFSTLEEYRDAHAAFYGNNSNFVDPAPYEALVARLDEEKKATTNKELKKSLTERFKSAKASLAEIKAHNKDELKRLKEVFEEEKKARWQVCLDFQESISKREAAERERLKENRKSNHLILLARNQEGFRNIIRMNNDAVLHGFYGKPRINREAMRKWGKGVIACTACASGELAMYLENGEEEKAEEFYEFLKSAFDDVYIEMTMVEWERQVELCKKQIQFARKVGGKLTVSLDSHYIEKEAEATQKLFFLMSSNQTVNDVSEETEEEHAHNLCCRTYDELVELFEEGFSGNSFKNEVFTREVFDEACKNTIELVKTIEPIKLDDTVKLPKVCEDGDEELAKRARAGLEKRFKEIKERAQKKGKKVDEKQYWDRLEYELDVIDKMGFADYFLIVERIIKMAIERFTVNAVGIGRGSGVGSLVNYCLEITDLDPIEHSLLFERFLDEGRAGVLACTFEA